MAAAVWTFSRKENLGSINMVRGVAGGAAADLVFDVSEAKTKTFTPGQVGLSTIIGGGAYTDDAGFSLSFTVTSTGCTVTTTATADVTVAENVSVTFFGK